MTDTTSLQTSIEEAFENINIITPSAASTIKSDIQKTLNMIDSGTLRVAEPDGDGNWIVNEWAKKAVLLSFRINENHPMGLAGLHYDKVASKFAGWSEEDFKNSGVRVVPPAAARHGVYIGKNTVLMPSYCNIGAYVDEGCMVDTWATVGSCAQIGKNVHLSGGVGIGGVLEPLQANPTIIEDDCFIGARSEVVEGVIVRKGSVLGMGVFISQSTKILNRETGEISYGEVPPYSVVVPGSMPSEDGTHSLACAVIVKTVDEKTRSKTGINELLRG